MRSIKIYSLVFLLVLSYYSVSAQEIRRDEVDKYTKNKIKETEWFKLKTEMFDALMSKIRKVNNENYLQLSVSTLTSFYSTEGDIAYFLLDNDSTVELTCVRGEAAHYVGSRYGSHWNGKILYKISDIDMVKFSRNLIVGVRLDLGDTYTTFDNIREKNAKKLQKALDLIAN